MNDPAAGITLAGTPAAKHTSPTTPSSVVNWVLDPVRLISLGVLGSGPTTT